MAVYASTGIVFGRRGGFNAVELLVFAMYCQSVFIALQMLNQVPMAIWHSPEAVRLHKTASPFYMTAIQAMVLALALKDFYRFSPRREAPRMLCAAPMFAAIKWGITQLYARAVVEIVMARISS